MPDVKADVFMSIIKGIVIEDTMKLKLQGKSSEFFEGYQHGLQVATDALWKGTNYLFSASEEEKEDKPEWNSQLN